MKAKYGYWLFGEGLEKIRGYAAEGLDIAAVAEKIGVAKSTLRKWRRRFPVLAELFCKDSESAEHGGESRDCAPFESDPTTAAFSYTPTDNKTCNYLEISGYPDNSDCAPHPAEHGGESRDCDPCESDPEPRAEKPFDLDPRADENSAPHPAAHDGKSRDCAPRESDPTTAFSYTSTDNKTCNYLKISGYPDNKTRNDKKTHDSGTTSESRRRADRLVENALLKRAVGYTVQEITRQPSKDTGELEITKIVEKDVMPSTAAQVFWLKNRCGWDAEGVQSADEDECGGVVLLPPVDGE